MTCPDDDALAALLENTAPAEERQALLVHLDACETCRGLVADVVAMTPDREAGGDERLGRGDTIGRYVIDRVLGAGAMGVVYAAHDPQLRRDVALKVLRSGVTDRDALLREARTVAQLSHPNVIAIHDVTVDDNQLAIAMELVEGTTLTAWLAARPRSWPQIRDVMLQAGRGISAAHAAGVVHRDIKPDNILVARDGRARVSDFGLANLPAGILAGTPAYMSPEQRAGRAVDARSDVYSLCVVLKEVAPSMPARTRRVVERGLADNPGDRPPLDDLLDALAPPRSHAVVIAALSVAVIAAVVAIVVSRSAGPEPCTGGDAAWADVWHGDAVRTAFEKTGLASSSAAFTRADAIMAAYRAAWIGEHRNVCLASERGEQSAELLDRRMRCLENRRKDAAALAALLTTADRGVADRAADLVQQLPPAAECTTTAVADLAPRPQAAAERARLEELEAQASEARAQQESGRSRACLATVATALPDAERLGYQPLVARLLFLRARCEPEDAKIVDDLHAAAAAATEGHDDETLARAWTRLLYMEGFVAHHFTEAARWEHYAHAVVDRLGRPTQLQLQLLGDASLALLVQQRMDEARALIEQRRAIIIAAQGPSSPALAEVEETLGNTYLDEWRFSEAYAHYRQAEALIDPHQSSINARLWLRQNESAALCGLGRAKDALALFPDIFALSAERDPSGDDSWARAMFANALREAGEPGRALEEHRKASETCERFSGAQGWRCAHTFEGQGRDLIALGRLDEAAAPIEHALALYGPDGGQPDTPFVLALAIAGKDPKRAIVLAEQSRATLRKLVDERHADRKRLDEIEAWLAARR